jgi:hypothetical protein
MADSSIKSKIVTTIEKLFSQKSFNLGAFVVLFAAMMGSIIIFSYAAPRPSGGGSPAISIFTSPSSQKLQVGHSTTIAIYEDSLDTGVKAVQVNLSYDPKMIDVVSLDSFTSRFDVKAQSSFGDGAINLDLGHIGSLMGKQLVANIVIKPKVGTGKANLIFKAGTTLISYDSSTNVLQKTVSGTYSLSR